MSQPLLYLACAVDRTARRVLGRVGIWLLAIPDRLCSALELQGRVAYSRLLGAALLSTKPVAGWTWSRDTLNATRFHQFAHRCGADVEAPIDPNERAGAVRAPT